MARLETWPEVREYLVGRGGEAAGSEVRLAIAGVPAMVIAPVEVCGAAWLRVGCTIGSMRVLTAAEMLVNNRGASVGFFGTRDGDLALRQLLPLGLSSEDLDETVETIAQMAAFTAARISAMGG